MVSNSAFSQNSQSRNNNFAYRECVFPFLNFQEQMRENAESITACGQRRSAFHALLPQPFACRTNAQTRERPDQK